MTEAICPAVLEPMPCMSRKLEESVSWPTFCTTRADIGNAEMPEAPMSGLMRRPETSWHPWWFTFAFRDDQINRYPPIDFRVRRAAPVW